MNPEEQKVVKQMRKKLRRNPTHRFFVASKFGGNAAGRGADRAVILHSYDGKVWSQYYKVWGENNVARANEIIKLAKQPRPQT